MEKYRVEYAFAENFASVDEWFTDDDLMAIEAENAEEAAENASYTDGLENALFRVCMITGDSIYDYDGNWEYYSF